jgi:hypothetical protein
MQLKCMNAQCIDAMRTLTFPQSVQRIYPLRLTQANNTYRIPLDQSPMYVLRLVRFILSQWLT